MLSTKQIRSKIGGIKRSNNTVRANIQTVLINTAGHVLYHGDVTCLDALFAATGAMNRKLIVKFAQDYCLAHLDAKSGKFKVSKAKRKTAQDEFDSGDAYVTHLEANAPDWWEKAESAADIVKELDMVKRLESLVAAIDKGLADGTVIKFDRDRYDAAKKHMEESVAKVVAQ